MFLFLVENFPFSLERNLDLSFIFLREIIRTNPLLSYRAKTASTQFWTAMIEFLLFLALYYIYLSISRPLYISIRIWKEETRKDSWYDADTIRARACVCVRVNCCCFCFRHWKDGLCVCARNCATYLSFDLTCVCVCACMDIWMVLVYVRMEEKKNEATYLPNIVTSELLLMFDRGIIHWRHR